MTAKNLVIKARLIKEKKIKIQLKGRCMQPLLYDGDYAVVESYSGLKEGNLYLFELNNGDLAIHRLIKMMPDSLLFKGDRSKGAEFVHKENVIGEVKEVIVANGAGFIRVSGWFLGKKWLLFLSRRTCRQWEKDKTIKSKHQWQEQGFWMELYIITAKVLRKVSFVNSNKRMERRRT